MQDAISRFGRYPLADQKMKETLFSCDDSDGSVSMVTCCGPYNCQSSNVGNSDDYCLVSNSKTTVRGQREVPAD